MKTSRKDKLDIVLGSILHFFSVQFVYLLISKKNHPHQIGKKIKHTNKKKPLKNNNNKLVLHS